LFGGCIIDRPAMDMIRFTKFTNGNSWIGEFGDPENAEDFKVLYKLSPYHQIKPKVCYPPTLVMIGDQDQTTPPAHAYKFTAALQRINSHCNNPVLLKMMWGAGHTFGSTREQVVDSRTDEVMFMIKIQELNGSF
jgi:prolyl oligopeptidase